ncbi:AraC family transcriptional regulator [Mucilaginibacter pedocola]|uniref:AraC family transcriptional regulator n=1 Tax=Mucilaginibacter pedocola TaxID=1792845 RepID=UPI0009936880|nr:AraC family transcriptional regulator [Mucilaginibacter pedocola]
MRVTPSQQITFHQHESLEISYIVLGSGRRVIGNTADNFNQGEVIFIPSNIPHCWSFDNFNTAADGKIENISIFFTPQLLQTALDGCPELHECFTKILSLESALVFTGQTRERLQELMRNTRNESKTEQFASLVRMLALIAESAQMEIVGSVVVEDRSQLKLQQAYSYVINNFQREITLADAAAFVGMEKSSFCTFFKRKAGKPFFTFLAEYRVESAVQMLQRTGMSVAEVCHAVGFNDVPYFNRVFKKVKNMPPSQFRNSVPNNVD